MENIIKKLKNNKCIEYIGVTIIFIAINIIFAKVIGILDSGYHLTDDHEIIDISYQIQNNGLFNTMKYYIINDLNWRYRPLYFIFRIIRTLIFGTNFYCWHLFMAIECGLYMGLNYILARKMKTPIIASVIFSFIFLVGTQDEIIWRLGPQESTGLLLMTMSFLFVYCYFDSNKKIYGILAALSTIMMMLYKESFLLCGPSVILFLFLLFVYKNDEDKNIFKLAIDFIKKYKYFILIIIINIIIDALIILFYVGLLKPGYAGIDTSYTFAEYIRLTLNVLFVRDLKDYCVIYVLMVMIVIYSIIIAKKKNMLSRKYIQIIFVALIFLGYSVVMQGILHGKSAMFDRYKIPCVWFIFFVLIILEKKIINSNLHNILIIIVCVYMLCLSNNTPSSLFYRAKWYGEEGKDTTKLLDSIGDLKKNNEDLVVLTDLTWYEHNLSASIYLQIQKEIDKVYYMNPDKNDGEYEKEFRVDGSHISIENADVIITEGDKLENYNLENYELKEYSNKCVLIKK